MPYKIRKKNGKFVLVKQDGTIHKQGDKIIYFDSEEKAKDAAKAIMANEKKESITFQNILSPVYIQEAKDGSKWDVVLIEVGMSDNYGSHGLPRFYPEETLKKKEVLKLFENAPAMAYKFEGSFDDMFDHVPGQSGKMAANQVGFFENVHFGEFETKEGHKGKGILAKFTVLDTANWLKENLKQMWKAGKQMLGFSIDAEGSETPRSMGNIMVDWVEKLDTIFENTVVTHPAAGGGFVKMVASRKLNIKESKVGIEKLLALLKEVAPHLLEGKDLTKITEDECESLLKEAFKPEKKEEKSEVKSNVKTETVKESKKQTFTFDETKFKESDERITELERRNAKLEQDLKLRESQSVLKQKLSESNLPDAIQNKIKKQYSGKLIESKEVDTIIADEQEVLSKLHVSKPISEAKIEIGSEERDKFELAMDGFWEGQDQKDKDGKKVKAFYSFKEAYATIMKDPSAVMASPQLIISDSYWFMPKMETVSFAESYDVKRRRAILESRRMTESLISTDWAEILGNTLNRKMMKEFMTDEYQSWRRIVSDINPVSDFRAQRRLKMGGYGILSAVSEQATYQPLTSPGDTEITYTPSKKGGLESITIEMVANDDVGSIRKIPVKLGRAGIITIYRNIFDMFINNLESDGTTTLGSSARGNAVGSTTALTGAGFETAVLTMRKQTVYGDTYDYIGMAYEPRFLLVPAALEGMAKRIYASDVRIGTSTLGTDTNNTEPNIWKGTAEPIVVPYWDATSTAQWWMVANPLTAPTIEVGFFQGKQEPELFVQDNPSVGSVFTADKITYKIRYIYGYNILDYKAFFLGES